MQVAREWRLTPSQWDALDQLDQIEMIALQDAESKMQVYEQEEAERNRSKS